MCRRTSMRRPGCFATMHVDGFGRPGVCETRAANGGATTACRCTHPTGVWARRWTIMVTCGSAVATALGCRIPLFHAWVSICSSSCSWFSFCRSDSFPPQHRQNRESAGDQPPRRRHVLKYPNLNFFEYPPLAGPSLPLQWQASPFRAGRTSKTKTQARWPDIPIWANRQVHNIS